MDFFTRIFVFHFDRSFSGKGWRQLLWLCVVIFLVFIGLPLLPGFDGRFGWISVSGHQFVY